MQLTRHAVPVALATAVLVMVFMLPWQEVYSWAIAAQREFQNAMARGLRAIQSGNPSAVITLSAATFAYGFVHALGPGHGKIIIGGAAVASQATARTMVFLAVVSALAQAMTAIIVVLAFVGGLSLLTSGSAVDLAERWLAPLSYGAFILIGSVLVWRGVRVLSQSQYARETEPYRCDHSHGPTPQQVETLRGWRDKVALVASVAVRPCTGALFLLVISARFNMLAVGIVATLAMGLGTAAFNALVAISGVIARRLVQAGETVSYQLVIGFLHIAGGGMIISLSLVFLLPHFSG